MDFGNSYHLYAAPQTLAQPQPQPQPPQPAAAHLYSTYYTANPDPYHNPQAVADPSSSSLVFADGAVAQAADPYAGSGFNGQAVSYGAYQQHQLTASYSYAPTLAAASFQQAKKKLKIRSNILDLEGKKQKIIEGGASADEVRVCTICNVVCNSATVFTSHLAGEKHALKVIATSNNSSMVPEVMAHIKQMNYAKKSVPKADNKRYGIGYIAAPKTVQTFACEVCKIECNSPETLNTHKMGKKHTANLQKLQEKITPKPSVASAEKKNSTGQDQTTNVGAVKKTSSAKEDLQTKKDKVVQGGAVVEDIMVCVLCDVVCNSKAVYNSHIIGKKHLSMIKKQEETQVEKLNSTSSIQ